MRDAVIADATMLMPFFIMLSAITPFHFRAISPLRRCHSIILLPGMLLMRCVLFSLLFCRADARCATIMLMRHYATIFFAFFDDYALLLAADAAAAAYDAADAFADAP